jgi:LIM domain
VHLFIVSCVLSTFSTQNICCFAITHLFFDHLALFSLHFYVTLWLFCCVVLLFRLAKGITGWRRCVPDQFLSRLPTTALLSPRCSYRLYDILCTGVSCSGCSKPVYAMEKQMSASGQTFHQACFKCSHCKSQLTLSNWSIGDGKIFCKTHYLELFKGVEGFEIGPELFHSIPLFLRHCRGSFVCSKRWEVHVLCSNCYFRVRIPGNRR